MKLPRAVQMLVVVALVLTAWTVWPTLYRRGDMEEGTRIFVSGVLGPQAFQAVPEDRKQQMRENHTADSAQLLGAGFPRLSVPDVAGIRVPTLLVTGENSPALFRRTLTLKLARLLLGVEQVQISDASHLMHEQNADGYNHAVMAFLRRHPIVSPVAV